MTYSLFFLMNFTITAQLSNTRTEAGTESFVTNAEWCVAFWRTQGFEYRAFNWLHFVSIYQQHFERHFWWTYKAIPV